MIRVKICDPNMDLLRQAVKSLAKEIGAEFTNEIEDYLSLIHI